MKYLIEFPLESGDNILVEVEEPETSGMERAALPGTIIAKVNRTFESVLEKVKPAAGLLIGKLRGLSDPPDEITVEFGLKMNAEGGALIASSSVEANYTIKLLWKREQHKGE